MTLANADILVFDMVRGVVADSQLPFSDNMQKLTRTQFYWLQQLCHPLTLQRHNLQLQELLQRYALQPLRNPSVSIPIRNKCSGVTNYWQMQLQPYHSTISTASCVTTIICSKCNNVYSPYILVFKSHSAYVDPPPPPQIISPYLAYLA